MLEVKSYCDLVTPITPNREERVCCFFRDQVIFCNWNYHTTVFNLKTKKATEIKEFFQYVETVSDDTFVGVKENGELFFINDKLKVVDKIKLPSTTIVGIFSPSKNILCLVDLEYIFIYSCSPKKLFILKHISGGEKTLASSNYAQFFKLSDNLIILSFYFNCFGFTVFDWKLKQIINTAKQFQCFVNRINGRIFDAKNAYSINKNLQNTKYLCFNARWPAELFSAYQCKTLRKIKKKANCGFYFSTLIKGHNERYILNLSNKIAKTQNRYIEIIDSYTNKSIFSVKKNLPEWVHGPYLFNNGDYIVALFRSLIVIKVNHDKFPKTDNEDISLRYKYEYHRYYADFLLRIPRRLK